MILLSAVTHYYVQAKNTKTVAESCGKLRIVLAVFLLFVHSDDRREQTI